MRTTLNLDEELVRELMKVPEAKTKTAAIHQAMSEAIRRRKLDQLKSLNMKKILFQTKIRQSLKQF